jgi:hypothetical protein
MTPRDRHQDDEDVEPAPEPDEDPAESLEADGTPGAPPPDDDGS